MRAVEAVVLGLIQGLTEFLPISSSAHLILTSALLGWRDQGLTFDMAAHAGSLVALVVYFRRDLARLGRAWAASWTGSAAERGDAHLAWALLVATLPVAVAGLLFQDQVATAGRSAALVATTSILFGLLLGWADRHAAADRDPRALGWGAILAVGLAQAVALVPGVSRAGITITAGLLLGLSRRDAARLSFLLALPVGVLVAGKQLVDLWQAGGAVERWLAPALGFAASGVAAWVAIGFLLAWVRRRGLTVFVVYRVALGLAIWSWLVL